jgi:hypothetical protein
MAKGRTTGSGNSDVLWTTEADEHLRSLAASGKPLANIAEALNRSTGSVRMRASRLKIKIVKSGKLMACPAWLGLSEDRTSFVFFPDRAEIVREIFQLSVAGLGGYTIANQLNAKNVPAFGSSKRWDQSTINNMLRSRATIGDYQPRLYQSAVDRSVRYRDRKGTPAGDVVRNYYPAVIDEGLFDRAQEARRENLASRRGRKGRLITNLFAGIPTCSYCEAPVKFHSNGNAKSLICSTVLERKPPGCCRKGWSYRSFEESFLNLVTQIDLEHTATEREKDTFSELRTLVGRATSGADIYDARLALALALKSSVSRLKLTSAGLAPPADEPNARIRRDDSARFFQVSFFGGATHTVFPAALDSGASNNAIPEAYSDPAKILEVEPARPGIDAGKNRARD